MELELRVLLESLKTCLERGEDRPRTLEPGHYTSQAYYDLEVVRLWKKE
jgi:hypothetical protein